ncbi:ATP-dependent zinc metalloprotease FtsH [Conexibacter stalactiti]|uniref:ATP-dependent zinc metalloprotease FtsH n=1 Tax=Conexibacter stalactiti TaxID=1940611 RepID=A0ABU4HM84_9ACTN|nr:ATP-dependent zinc metalloprotease FtsH [Conexibacter stalactiti]MDW5593675.1 ATP-dependent zinc metalloprotease FtsH [Conexibacter stalactiti]MEC5034316.1 ATP-dependent zinc metalloprotease FtsH [Conexibacter stalactiti]
MPADPSDRRQVGDRLPTERTPPSDPRTPPRPPGWRVTPAPDGRGTQQRARGGGYRGPRMPGGRWGILAFVVVLLGLNWWISSRALSPGERVQVPYNPQFLQEVRDGNVREISSTGASIQGDFKRDVTYPARDDKDSVTSTKFSTEVPAFANTDALSDLLEENDVVINAKPPDSGPSLFVSILLGFGPVLLIILLFVMLSRRMAGAGGGMMSFGRSRARRAEDGDVRVTFRDVAGIDEAENELHEIVDFLKNPQKYQRLGGKIPKGVLLSGQPGTGKTLLARAVAGEAGVPFFSMSASEFVEMIVGVGASRVRDLFRQAKEAAPAIIFIDELDAIGRARGGGRGSFGGNDEREQTLNQILTEMDGFEPSTAVIVIAATNRPEILDQALLRPGRFDRRVTVAAPDRVGRLKILKVHTRSVPLADDIDLDAIASTTPGMVGADLANLVNEGALLAARRGHTTVNGADFADALEKVVLGAERKVMMSDDDRRRTAYHEAGHAVVGMLTAGADPVRKVSIIPRGQALGVTFSSPDADKYNYDERYLVGKIKVALGGRVAEEVVFGDLTTGAESDIQQLTGIARQMVGRWGMSPAIGPIAVLASEGNGMLLPGVQETSESTQRLVDEEVRRIVDGAHADVTRLLREYRANLDSLVAELLERETLDEADAYRAAGLSDRRPERRELPPGERVLRDASASNGNGLPENLERPELPS